jgi:AcrR family transcriptional regulator
MNDTKEHIIKTSCLLFLQKSYKEVTLQEIVKKTGLSKGAFYHYFTSKEDVFIESIQFFFGNLMQRNYDLYSKETFYQFYHDYMEDVTVCTRKIYNYFEIDDGEKDFQINYFGLIFDALKLFPEYRQQMIEEMNRELNIWISIIRIAKQKGEITDSIGDEDMAKMFYYIGDGLAMNLILRGITVEDLLKPTFTLWDKLYEQIKT